MIIIPFTIYVSLRKDDPHLILLCLNEDMELGNYPTHVSIDENISLYFIVNSFWDDEIHVQVRHIVGKNSTINISSNGSSNGTIVSTYNRTMQVLSEWKSDEIISSFSEILNDNEHYLIIFELWAEFGTGWEFMHDQIVYVRLNATSI